MGKSLKSHWEKVYNRQEIDKLGWYEDVPEPSLRLIEKCNLDKAARILNIGAGATTLIDELLEREYTSLIATDISILVLDKLKDRLQKKAGLVDFVVDDLTNPINLSEIESVDLWHDRAVLHFLTEAKDQDTYFSLLRKLVKKGAFVILAEFSLVGATKCSGLDVYRYSVSTIKQKLGSGFELIENFEYTYTQPSGDKREFVYTLFRRI